MQNSTIFKDRAEAGRLLAKQVKSKRYSSPLVLALPRGGVPVAHEVARRLHCPVSILVACKLGAPLNPEFAFGAVAEEGGEYMDEEVVSLLHLNHLQIEGVREQAFDRIKTLVKELRGETSLPSMADKNVIIVDDGVATGSTAVAAARSAKKLGASRVVVAAPVVAPGSIVFQSSECIDEVIYITQPQKFLAVGQWYRNFDQVSMGEAASLIKAPDFDRFAPKGHRAHH